MNLQKLLMVMAAAPGGPPKLSSWPRRVFPALVLVLSLAACGFLLMQVINTERPDAIGGQSKPRLDYIVGPSEPTEPTVFATRRGGVVHPGESVTWFVTSPGVTHAAVLGRDASGAVSSYVPASGTGSVKVDGQGSRQLAVSAKLDGALGRHDVYAVFCRGSFDTAALAEQMSAAGRAPEPISGCTTSEVMVVKQAP